MGVFRRIYLLLGLLLTISTARAGIIKGRISGASGEPLPFANVAVRGTATSTGSNDQGQYQLRLPAGPVTKLPTSRTSMSKSGPTARTTKSEPTP